MANVIVTFKVMPESPEVDLEDLKDKVVVKIEEFGIKIGKVEEEPIGFGLKALKIIFIMDESEGSTDKIEDGVKKIENVKSVEAVDVRRALG
tara:strand:+ start:5919 stop:6194 length:276 start_codon:yes stop_codon:yes gene_type:complete